ncbi:MAG: 3-phosphoshikimate 1-carboxyvinyltransferase [Gammaproteobacteria bacterium]|nr:3-phosphoshikimate 1-carboxyvinyltransferase [Gammaproteobacteria bacterium]
MSLKGNINFRIEPSNSIIGKVNIPGDKSISHRAIILAAIADGESRIKNFLQGEDTLATIRVFQKMGVNIKNDGDIIIVKGVGLHGLRAENPTLDFGNSGTSVRLLSGLLSAQNFSSQLIGDESLMKRPMFRIINPLQKMNAKINCTDLGTLPIKIEGGQKIEGIEYELPIFSAQLKSCLLLAGLYAEGTTKIIENMATRDHTERMLANFSHSVIKKGNQISIKKADRLIGCEIIVPGDFSSAAYFIVAAILTPNSNIILENVGVNPTRNAMIKIMKLMGADVELKNERLESGEPVATIYAKTSKLIGIDIPEELVPVAIDELPIILVAAACAKGKTKLSGAAELRVKESDRIQSMLDGFISLGIKVKALEDGMIIEGGQYNGGVINSNDDHRIAMAFSIAGIIAKAPIIINSCKNVATSFPEFVDTAKHLGMNIDYV